MNAHAARRLATSALAAALAALLLATAAGCRRSTGERDLTIVLVEYKGPEALSSAQRIAKELSAQGLPGVFIVEGAEYASVCVGRFKSWKDADADAMLKRVRIIRDAQGQFPFAGVLLVPVPEPLPESPWPLEEADGLFTLHIASWEAPGRMANAQEYAAALRSRGYEAYVYHGPRLSMVTLGAFGLNIFDDPTKVGLPNEKPKILDPKVLDLIQKFPRMRLEGEEVPPEAHVPTQLVTVPGKEPPAGAAVARPRTLYRVTLSLIDTQTGLADMRQTASGVAQAKEQVPTLVGRLVRQLMEALQEDRPVRVGVAGVSADPAAAKDGLDAVAVQALGAALQAAGRGKIRLFSLQGTRQMLDAAGHKVEDVLQDPRRIKGFDALDLVVVGSVRAF